ncbi:MAG: hypothetical protein AB7R89_04295 [Dehalococcoidia bacterium]
MTADETERLMARAAMLAEERPFFVAAALAIYRALRQIDNAALAAELGCTEIGLSRLALCRRPDGDGAMFRTQVERIARHAGCRAESLANVLRAASAVEKMQAATPSALLAARDRISEEPAGYETPIEPDAPAGVKDAPL